MKFLKPKILYDEIEGDQKFANTDQGTASLGLNIGETAI